MKVLLVSVHFPENSEQSETGAFQRLRMWVEAIRSLGGELEMLFLRNADGGALAKSSLENGFRVMRSWGCDCPMTVCESDISARGDTFVDNYLRPALSLKHNPLFAPYVGAKQSAAFATCLARSPDVVLFYYFQATLAGRVKSLGGVRTILDLPDIEHRRFARDVGQPPRWLSKPLKYFQVPSLWWGERAAITQSTMTCVSSTEDLRYLRRSMGVRNVSVIPNGVAQVNSASLSPDPNVLFVGTFGYSPNVVAADFLVRKVWPLLLAMCPQAKLLIAGPRPEEIPHLSDPPQGVEFLGFVTDLGALYRKTRVFCCPIQSGSGTRIKILEAASYGVPVVSTRMGAEGIEFEPDREIVIGSSETAIARECARLLTDYDRAQRIGAAARQRVRELYSRDKVIAQMRACLTSRP